MSRRVFLGVLLLLVAGLVSAAGTEREEFFIVSSLDAARGRVVLKRPTEVTVPMRVTEQTAYRDEHGKPFTLKDLRPGDTAYITFRQGPGGEPTALLVKLGPMTVAELQRRYLRPASR